jgi:hypothetical protein
MNRLNNAVIGRTPASAFAAAWRAALTAAADDDARPALYRAVYVEHYGDDRWRFTALDGALAVSVALGDPAPTLDEAPAVAFLVGDHDHRGKGLAGYAAKLAHRAMKANAPAPWVTLAARDVVDPDRPTLAADLATQELILELDEAETVALPVLEVAFPTYRSIIDGPAGDRGPYAIAGNVLAKVATIAGLVGGIAVFDGPGDTRHAFTIRGAWDEEGTPAIEAVGVYMCVRMVAATEEAAR